MNVSTTRVMGRMKCFMGENEKRDRVFWSHTVTRIFLPKAFRWPSWYYTRPRVMLPWGGAWEKISTTKFSDGADALFQPLAGKRRTPVSELGDRKLYVLFTIFCTVSDHRLTN